MGVPILGGGLTTWEKFPRKVVFFWSVSLIDPLPTVAVQIALPCVPTAPSGWSLTPTKWSMPSWVWVGKHSSES